MFNICYSTSLKFEPDEEWHKYFLFIYFLIYTSKCLWTKWLKTVIWVGWTYAMRFRKWLQTTCSLKLINLYILCFIFIQGQHYYGGIVYTFFW